MKRREQVICVGVNAEEDVVIFEEVNVVDRVFFFSSRRRHTRFDCDWSSDVCSSDLLDFDVENDVRFQVQIIAICGDPNSNLAKNSHVVLDVNIEQEACPLNLAPTSSTTVMLALGDALAMVLLEARGFQKEDFARFHPAGMIGRSLLLRVHQIMRPREALALGASDTRIRDVLKTMTAVRAGAAVIADADGKLLGIFRSEERRVGKECRSRWSP